MRFRRPGLLQDGLALVAEHHAVWPLLLAEEQQHLMNDTDQLLASKTWKAARGSTLDDTVQVVVAAQAALLVLGLSLGHYRGVSGVIIHPTTQHIRGERPGPSAGTVSARELQGLEPAVYDVLRRFCGHHPAARQSRAPDPD